MSFEKVLFAFFIILAFSLNYGFVAGDIADAGHHHHYELIAALVVSLICTIMKFGDRTKFGSTMLASSLVADLQLIVAIVLWGIYANSGTVEPSNIASVVSLASGALVANALSVVLLVIETSQIRK